MTEQPGPRRLVLVAVVAVVVATLAVLPRFAPDGSPDDATTTTSEPQALSERAPFGVRLTAALAYYGANREFNLIDLRTGRSIGSKGVPNDRRPVGSTSAAAILGNLPAGVAEGNWDEWLAMPWEGTEATPITGGNAIAYSPALDVFAAAMRPLPEGGNGVVIADGDATRTAASSNGLWSFLTWIGDRVLVREATGDQINWWAIPASTGQPAPLDLPADFRPIAGTDGLVMGELAGEGVIIDLATGDDTRLPGGWSWAAEWRPGDGDPLLATVGGTPPTLVAYNRNGSFSWSWPLGEGTTQFRGGVAWAPDGSFLVAPGGGSIQAFTDFGGALGAMDPALPPAETSDAGFVAVVPLP